MTFQSATKKKSHDCQSGSSLQVRSACPSGDYLSVGFFLNRGCTSFTPTWWRPPLRRRDLADRAGSDDCQVSLMGIIGTIIRIITIILINNGTRGLRLSNISGGHNHNHHQNHHHPDYQRNSWAQIVKYLWWAQCSALWAA